MITAILLAAGESSRMGRPKALLPFGGGTLIEYQVRQLGEAGCDDIVVVLGHDAEAQRSAVPAPARVAVNESYREGRASSLRCGADAAPDDAGAVVVLGVDQPRPASITTRLIAAQRDRRRPIALPVADGRRGHPVVLAGALLPELRAVTEETEGLRAVIAAHDSDVAEEHFEMNPHEFMLGPPDYTALFIHIDINTPEEYDSALEVLRIVEAAPSGAS